MWKIAAAAVIITLILLTVIDRMSTKIERLESDAEVMENELKTHERIRDADVGRGDVDDDTRWLCKRAGRGDCGP